MLENLDLNIQNYNLNDLLNLFKLKNNFTEEDLKNAKKIVLKTHPDMSKLDKKYFLFFSSAYKIVFQIYNFKNRIESKNTEYYVEEDENNKLLIEKVLKKDNFNEWFNKEFEKIIIKENDNGYEEWLKSEENMDYRTTTKNNMERDIYEKKKELRSIVKREEIKSIQELQDNNILGLNEVEEYSSDIFGNFRYEDLKKAHIETVIPVTEEDIDEKNIFNNLEQLNRHRNSENLTPLSLKQANEYLHDIKNNDEEININRAYNLALENENNIKKNNDFMKRLRQIK
mgnify:CR=1 FL=1|tara:strand:+ start:285 stop:1139 length:855 start_codon:yes stop_codon:yes gene_type:complete